MQKNIFDKRGTPTETAVPLISAAGRIGEPRCRYRGRQTAGIPGEGRYTNAMLAATLPRRRRGRG